MIVKFHARGRGGGAGPVDYLLGQDRNRAGASVLQGKPDEVRELIDSSPYVKKYTSGVLSFAEADLPPGQREKLMASFEQVLLPGLDKDQYSVLWVEHQDKGRLELNFVIPNVELVTGKRLQPYFDRADRPRIDAWQTVVNARLGLHDPNDPTNRRALVTPSTLPKTAQAAAETITAGLLRLAEAGEITTRQDVLSALEGAGFEIARTTTRSISLANPDGGRNIRLKGALYEQHFDAGEGLRAEIENAGERYRADAENRVQRARTVCESGIGLKRRDNQARYPRPQPERTPDGHENVALRPAYAVPGVRGERESAVVFGGADPVKPGGDRPAERNLVNAERQDLGRDISRGREGAFFGVAGGDESRIARLGDGGRESEAECDQTGEGVRADDRIGAAVIERAGRFAAGLRAAAARMGERLRGIADDVWTYATGEWSAESASEHVESAGQHVKSAGDELERSIRWLERSGATLERSASALEPLLNRHDALRKAERARALKEAKALEPERPRPRTGYGPSL
jgi:hypothetical protein